jgi:hypothetical protein
MRVLTLVALIISLSLASVSHAALAYPDVVLKYYDGGQGPISGPYGGYYPEGYFPIAISPNAALGPETGDPRFADFLSLSTGSYVIVGFTDESIINGPGYDFGLTEYGSTPSILERASVYVSSDCINFTYIGIASSGSSPYVTTSFDLANINFTGPVAAIKILGLDTVSYSPGYDLGYIQIASGSIGDPVPPAVVPIPGAVWLLGSGFLGLIGLKRIRRKNA